MWSYYGAKTNIVKHYPPPRHHKIIELFAGSARYSLEYWERDVLLMDKYDVIIKLWQWLQKCSPKDVLSIPRLKRTDDINDFKFDCEEQRLLLGFLIGVSAFSPLNKVSPMIANRPNRINYNLLKISSSLHKIRHWEIRQGSYEEIPNQRATWFIDAPYQKGGDKYKCSNKSIDFEHLADYSRRRIGQVIVCESTDARWLPFQPLIKQHVVKGGYEEAMWTKNCLTLKL